MHNCVELVDGEALFFDDFYGAQYYHILLSRKNSYVNIVYRTVEIYCILLKR
jgi:hypothetical protein